MMHPLLFMMLLAAAPPEGVVIDRIAVIVGKHAIKTSDIDLDIRITDFLNRVPLRPGSTEKHQSAERLIDQEIIRQEIISGGYRRPAAGTGAALEGQFVKDRFAGSEARLRAALGPYGVTEDQLCAQLLWQFTVLQFISQRFSASGMVSDEDVRAYYDAHRAELEKQHPNASGFEQLEPSIRSLLENQQTDKRFNEWLDQARKETRIEYRSEAFQ